MSRKKLLHELLREDQEPFVLENYVADRRRLLQKPSSSNTQVQDLETSTRPRNNFSGNNEPSSCRTPEFSPPTGQKERIEEEDKEQCSPVSILDPPFEDDEGEDDGDNLDRSSSTAECAKAHQPSKVSRFEKLVELDPVELKKKMDEVEEDGDDDEDFEEGKSTADKFNKEKRLIADNIAGEKRHKTIDMTVERDLKMESEKKITEEEIREETAMDVELAILAFLVEELAIELDR